jgi:hypothetical protein
LQAVLLDQQSQPLHAMTKISVIAPLFMPCTDEQERPGRTTTQHENRGYGRLGSGKNYKHKLLALHRDDSEGSDNRLSSEFLHVQAWTLRPQHCTIQSKTDRGEAWQCYSMTWSKAGFAGKEMRTTVWVQDGGEDFSGNDLRLAGGKSALSATRGAEEDSQPLKPDLLLPSRLIAGSISA